jgi:hypothetical protein
MNKRHETIHRMAELILYFASASKDDELFGSIKLNKLLFVADFWAYGYLGKSITGATYIHQQMGPTPDPSVFLAAREKLERAGKLLIREESTIAGVRKRPVAQSAPDMSSFSTAEMSIAEAALKSLRHLNNVQSSEWSHELSGWRYTKMGEEIPYATAFVWHKIPATADDFAWAEQEILAIEGEG